MNAKHIILTVLATLVALCATPALALDSLGGDTLSKCCWAGELPLGAVITDADGGTGVVHVGNLVETTTRSGTTTSIQLFDGDLQDALVYDYDWAVFPEDVSDSMADFAAMTDSTELLGIIVRNTEEAVELAPLGVPMAGDNGTMDINPISILETTAGLALTTKTVDDLSMCCLLSNHYPITAATTDSDGYVGFSSVGSIATADAGDVQVTTTAATTSSYSTGRR